MRLADQGKNTDAKAILQSRLDSIKASPLKGSAELQAFLSYLQISLPNSGRAIYVNGGKANMMEARSRTFMS